MHTIMSVKLSFYLQPSLSRRASLLLILHIRGAPWYLVTSTAASGMHNNSSPTLSLTTFLKSFQYISLLSNSVTVPDIPRT